MNAVDVDFKNAVLAAARRKDSARLIEFLRSDRPMGRGERDMLADLVAGDLARPRGNPNSLKSADVAHRERAIARIAEIKKDRKAAGLKHLAHDLVVDQVAQELRIIPDQLREWARTRKHR